jgi:glucose-6-phosphate isomerase
MTGLLTWRSAAGIAVRGADAVAGADDIRQALVRDGVPGLLVAKDPTLWGADAQSEAASRLGWLDTFRRSRALLPQLAELRAELGDLDHVVLAGMGGSSLAPEVIGRTLDKRLTVLDTTDPHQVRTALADRLDRTVVVVSSKSGSIGDRQPPAGVPAGVPGCRSDRAETGRRFVMVTDPGSPLATEARRWARTRCSPTRTSAGGTGPDRVRCQPAALLGVDVAELLTRPRRCRRPWARPQQPGLAGCRAGGAAAVGGRDKLVLVEDGNGIVGLADWIEQLVAESTGKRGKGILPVVVESPSAPGATGEDPLTVTIGGALPPGAVPGGGVTPQVAVNGPLGAHFLLWEYAVAMAGRVLGVNPFDQPNVAESKENTARILAPPACRPRRRPSWRDRSRCTDRCVHTDSACASCSTASTPVVTLR